MKSPSCRNASERFTSTSRSSTISCTSCTRRAIIRKYRSAFRRAEFDSMQEAWAGRAAPGRLRLVNRSRIWNVRDVILTTGELSAPHFVPIINRRSEVAVEASFLFQRRGLVQLNTLDLYTRYP